MSPPSSRPSGPNPGPDHGPGRSPSPTKLSGSQAAAAKRGLWASFLALLGQPVAGTSLAVFRIFVGVVMALESYGLLVPHEAAITAGTPMEHYYGGPEIKFSFPYDGLEWLPLLPEAGMYAVAYLLIASGIAMALGLFYRVSSVMVFLCWGYFFAIESTRSYWQSHYYLELLTLFLMMFMPAARRWSLDEWRGAFRGQPLTIPFWPLFLLRGQLVIAYFYAGVAKFHYDWHVDGVPVRWFLSDANILTPYEAYLTPSQLQSFADFLAQPWLAVAICWIGTIFDCLVGFFLIIRRTRLLGFLLMLTFHATNWFIIFDDIGYFPILGATTATIFLESDWPERLWRWLRQPTFRQPEWKWALWGNLVWPVYGTVMGWYPAPLELPADERRPFRLSRWVAPAVLVWLVWQSVLPIRHYFISGDARFTYEGFSFSWRLKADSRHAFGHSLFIRDPQIIHPSTQARATIDWTAWRDAPVLYRSVLQTQTEWPGLPEIVVCLEPFLGERIIYNPFSGMGNSYTDGEAVDRVRAVWRRLYGREPELITPLSLAQTLNALIEALATAKLAPQERAELEKIIPAAKLFDLALTQPIPESTVDALRPLRETIQKLNEHEATAAIIRPILRKSYPFSLLGEGRRPAPFFIIEDAQLLRAEPGGWTLINRQLWKDDAATRPPRLPLDEYVGPAPMLVHYAGLGLEERDLMPQAYIADVYANPDQPPQIRWNSLQDLTFSKYMHTSATALYLRRYARRVASLWEEKYGRRPVINAITSVAYNARPHQELVDPTADLASVSYYWFRHNEWIRDLQMERIPREALLQKPKTYRLSKREADEGVSTEAMIPSTD